MSDVDLQRTTDGREWAEEFVRLFHGEKIGRDLIDGGPLVGEGLLTGWFANAIEVGRSAANVKAAPAIPVGSEAREICQCGRERARGTGQERVIPERVLREFADEFACDLSAEANARLLALLDEYTAKAPSGATPDAPTGRDTGTADD